MEEKYLKHNYKTKNTCSTKISFDLEGDIVSNISFNGGCAGNLQAIERILDGFTVSQIEEKCSGILCGRRGTSCADQLAIVVRSAYDKERAVK